MFNIFDYSILFFFLVGVGIVDLFDDFWVEVGDLLLLRRVNDLKEKVKR